MGDEFRLEPISICKSYADYARFAATRPGLKFREAESRLVVEAREFHVPGWCAKCEREVDFLVDHQYTKTSEPNWRERLVCPSCGLNNRLRLSLHFLKQFAGLSQDSQIYVTEQTTPFYSVLKASYGNVYGSEYLRDGTPRGGVNARGLRHEDITALSFRDRSFDFIATFDVLEHVPDFKRGIEECARCLKPDGGFLITVPFNLNSETTLIRARVLSDGSIEHLLPAQYHGDPLSAEGVLCYQTFGWDLLTLLAETGFPDPAIYFFWSEKFGYLGGLQFVIFGRKA